MTIAAKYFRHYSKFHRIKKVGTPDLRKKTSFPVAIF